MAEAERSGGADRLWARPDGQLLQALQDLASLMDRLETSQEAVAERLAGLERALAPAGGDPALTPSQVAEQLGVSVRWVYDQLRGRQLTHVRLEGQGLRVRQSALDAYLAARTVPAEQPEG